MEGEEPTHMRVANNLPAREVVTETLAFVVGLFVVGVPRVGPAKVVVQKILRMTQGLFACGDGFWEMMEQRLHIVTKTCMLLPLVQ